MVEWRPGIVLDVARIKQAVLHWRGGVRYGGAEVTLVGRVETAGLKEVDLGDAGSTRAERRGPSGTLPLLRVTGTNQPFRLRARASGVEPSTFRPDQSYRVTGQILNSAGDNNHEIVLEVEHAEPVTDPR